MTSTSPRVESAGFCHGMRLCIDALLACPSGDQLFPGGKAHVFRWGKAPLGWCLEEAPAGSGQPGVVGEEERVAVMS